MIPITQVPRLSAHFTAAEMACPCCGFLYVGDGMHLVLTAAEILRSQIGRPVTVVSGCRCPAHNKEVGGAPNSRHLHGDAMDLTVRGVTPQQLRQIVRDLCPWIHGIGTGATKFHMDARPGPLVEWQYQ